MYSFKSRVRYSEVDRSGRLGIDGIVDYFQDCSTFQSENLDLGVEHLQKKHRAWLLNSWQVELEKPVELSENIEISTWSCGAKVAYGYRNFMMKNSHGEIAAKANSLWVFVDTETGHPARVEAEDIEPYGTEKPLEMRDYGRKILMPEVAASDMRQPFPVVEAHIDTNGHVNNAMYVRFAMEYAKNLDAIHTMRAEYLKPALKGEIIYPYTASEDGRLTVDLRDAGGSSYARVQFIEKEEHD